MKKFLALLLLLFTSCNAIIPNRQDALKKVLPSVVKVTHEVDSQHSAFCTGFIVSASKGLILTVKHCVDQEHQTFVNQIIPAEVIETSDAFALLRVEPMLGPPVELAKTPDRLEEVVAVGYGYSILEAAVRHISGTYGGDVILDGQLPQGMSGGPVVNMDGKVVAILQMNYPFGLSQGCGTGEIKHFLHKYMD